jgi:predicted tellurium resistance membrane protein TerC
VVEIALALAAAAVVFAGLGLESRLFSPGREPRRGEAILWSIGWLVLAVAVAAAIALTGGPAGEWTTVYLIERSLSLDNVFLFSLLLAYFFVPPELARPRDLHRHRRRAPAPRHRNHRRSDADRERGSRRLRVRRPASLCRLSRIPRRRRAVRPSANQVLRLVRRTVAITDDFRGRRLFVRDGGRLYGTPLLLVVVAIIAADIAFAVDSIPAAFAVTRDPVVIWTANAFALLGLGSLLVLVELLVRRLRFLDETIALILGFVGVKIIVADLVHISDVASLAIIGALIAGGTVASLIADRLDPPHPAEEATRRPPRCPRELTPPAAPASRHASD